MLLPMENIRLAGPQDADALLALQHRLDAQSSFMLLEPGEREREPGRLHARLVTQGEAGSFGQVPGPPFERSRWCRGAPGGRNLRRPCGRAAPPWASRTR
jgi:hypothetical protein